MGHRNSSAYFNDTNGLCSDRGGTPRAAAGTFSLKRASVKMAFARAVSLNAPALKVASSNRAGASRGAVWLLLMGIRFYQAVFAPVMAVGCKFYPSCSRYAAEAIARHGAVRGVCLALARLWRCRPLAQGGFDPVPDLGEISSNRAASGASNEVRS
jgi:putative membrane protein insertion efficiency factor